MPRSDFLIPSAIILAGIVLAVAIFIVRGGGAMTEGDPSYMRPVSPTDHILGNPEAPVIVVEYSDIECEYCEDFQKVMRRVMTERAADGQVAWAYRHFPLVHLHRNAAEHAEAAECVAEAGGDSAFFDFIDTVQAESAAGVEFGTSGYPSIVQGLGLSLESFEECRASDRMIARVAEDLDNALASGATGTPYVVILVQGAKPIPVSGALPYEAMTRVLDEALTRVVR